MRAAALRAIGAWNLPALQERLTTLAAATDTTPTVRTAAIEALARVGKAEGRRTIESLTEHGASTEVQAMALAALLDLDANAATHRIVGWLAALSPDRTSATAVVMARVLERRGASALLTSALEERPTTLTTDVAKLCIRQVRASGRDEPSLIAALGKAGRLDSSTRALTSARDGPFPRRRGGASATPRGVRRSSAARN